MADGKMQANPFYSKMERPIEVMIDVRNGAETGPEIDCKRPRLLGEAGEIVDQRNPHSLLLEITQALQSGDRPSATRLFREFSRDYASGLPGRMDKFLHIMSAMLKTARISAYDDLSKLILSSLFDVMRKCSRTAWELMLKALQAEAELFVRPPLDGLLLDIYEYALSRGYATVPQLTSEILKTSTRSLHSLDDSQRRMSALRFTLARILQRGKVGRQEHRRFEFVCYDMLSDRDSRVRLTALNALKKMIETDRSLRDSDYANMMLDSDRQVRIETLRLLQLFAKKFPETKVHDRQDRRRLMILLSDDAFSAVCQGVNDMDKLVRAEAAHLLGEFVKVGESYLDQTLDKKLMSSKTTDRGESVFRVKESKFALTKGGDRRHGGRWQLHGGREKAKRGQSEWGTGKRLNEVAPGETVQRDTKHEENESIMSQGAAGAFVTALEDEFMAVRQAAVYSLGKLAANRPNFALTALDHLADMFNDEIAQVSFWTGWN
ncbi:unnamed protein product, partial [Mesorhabditis spiculigera]